MTSVQYHLNFIMITTVVPDHIGLKNTILIKLKVKVTKLDLRWQNLNMQEIKHK